MRCLFAATLILCGCFSIRAQPEPDGEHWDIQHPPEEPIDARAPIVSGGVAAPFSSDVLRAVPRETIEAQAPAERGTELEAHEPGEAVPRDIAGAARVAILIAAILRGLIWATRQPFLGGPWNRLPMAARLGALTLATAGAAAADQIATGVNWPTAIWSAIFGLSGAVASHEIQQRVFPGKAKVK